MTWRSILGVSVSWLSARLLLVAADKWAYEGVCVLELRDVNDASRERLREALDLIRTTHPRLYARFVCDGARLALWPLADEIAGEYWHSIRACVLDTALLDQWSPTAIATAIVHEATHARLAKRHIRTTAGNRDRVERTCVKAEMEFAGLLGDPALVATIVNREIQRPALNAHEEERTKRFLGASGLPRWAVVAHRFLFRGRVGDRNTTGK